MAYRRRPSKNGLSAFKLMYVVKAGVLPIDLSNVLGMTTNDYRRIELLSLSGSRTALADDRIKRAGTICNASSCF